MHSLLLQLLLLLASTSTRILRVHADTNTTTTNTTWSLSRVSDHDAQTYNDYASFSFGDTPNIIRGAFTFSAGKFADPAMTIPEAIDTTTLPSSDDANLRAVVEVYPYGNCNVLQTDDPSYNATTAAPVFRTAVSVLVDDVPQPTTTITNSTTNSTTTTPVYSFPFTQQLEINTTAHPSLFKSLGGEDHVEFCARFVLTTTDNITSYASSSKMLASFGVDAQVRVPSTYDAAFELANQVVDLSMTSFVRPFIDLNVSFSVKGCICSSLYTKSTPTPTTNTTTTHDYYKCHGDTPTSVLPLFTPGADLRLCFEPGGWLDRMGNPIFVSDDIDNNSTNPSSHPEFMELERVETWVLQQLTGVTGVDSEGVNIVSGGGFRKAISVGQPDTLTRIQYLHAVPTAVPEVPSDSGNTNTVREYKIVNNTGATDAKRVAVVETPINYAFFKTPELPLAVEGTVTFRTKSARRALGEREQRFSARTRILLNDVETHDLALSSTSGGDVAAVSDKAQAQQAQAQAQQAQAQAQAQQAQAQQPKTTTTTPQPPRSGAGAFAMVLKLDESFKVASDTAAKANTASSPWFVAYMLCGILLGLVLIHGVLHLAGFRLGMVAKGGGPNTGSSSVHNSMTGLSMPGYGCGPGFGRRGAGLDDNSTIGTTSSCYGIKRGNKTVGSISAASAFRDEYDVDVDTTL